ncbi:MAG: gamma-glutamyltransferase, partial [Lysobacter sp.]
MLTATLLTLLVGCVATPPRSDTQAAPPVAGGEASGFVASANPLATQAGLDVLRRGGNAIDAAIAVQAMLGLVEPQSSGPAGGAFLMHYAADSQKIESYIGREQAPASASPAMFNDAEGRPLSRADAMLSGQATGVPGVMPALELAHRDHGRLPWNSLFEPVAKLADAGFEVTPRLQEHIDGTFPQASAPDVKRLFSHPDGTPLHAGETLRNPAYADSLRRIASDGAAALQRGPLAEAIVERLGQPPHGAQVTLADLASYRV